MHGTYLFLIKLCETVCTLSQEVWICNFFDLNDVAFIFCVAACFSILRCQANCCSLELYFMIANKASLPISNHCHSLSATFSRITLFYLYTWYHLIYCYWLFSPLEKKTVPWGQWLSVLFIVTPLHLSNIHCRVTLSNWIAIGWLDDWLPSSWNNKLPW